MHYGMIEGLPGVFGNKGTWQKMVEEHGNNLNFSPGNGNIITSLKEKGDIVCFSQRENGNKIPS